MGFDVGDSSVTLMFRTNGKNAGISLEAATERGSDPSGSQPGLGSDTFTRSTRAPLKINISAGGPNFLDGTSDRGLAQMVRIQRIAEQGSGGRHPMGHCYAAVWNYITQGGYGNMPRIEVPGDYSQFAKQFAYFADAHLSELGLRKLDLDNPYEAPPGAIVVVKPGTPGTAHPVAGDITIAMGNGRFLNDGEMGYGGSGNFPPGNGHVLGIYVPR